MLHKRFPACVSACLGLICISLTAGAPAQGLEEIVVTARKKEESLQDVPISISAFSADQLQSMGVNNNYEVSNMTVNFNTVQQLGRRLDRPVIRGMAAPSTFGEPNASYFIDGAYVSGTISTYTLGPIERVEILRGPQSTQFGRATFAGAVNYVTRRPSNEFEGEVLARAGENDTRTFSAWASGPVVEDKLLFFASAGYDQYGGEWNNRLKEDAAFPSDSVFIDPPQRADNSDLGGTQTKQAEGKLLWLINDNAEIGFKAGYVNGDDDHYPQLIVDTDELNCFVPGLDVQPGDPNFTTSSGAFCGPLDADGRENRLNIPDLTDGMTANLSQFPPPGSTAEDWISGPEDVGLQRDQYNVLLTYDHNFNDWQLSSKYAWNKSVLESAYDLDGTEGRPFTGLFHFYEDLERKDWSFEVRLDSPQDQGLRGSIGFYYFDFDEDSITHGSPGFAQGKNSAPVKSTTENIALFGSVEIDLADKWTFATEARVARDTKETGEANFCRDPDSPFFDPDNPVHNEVETDSLTPRFTLRYRPTDEATLYLQVAKGNKPGNFNVAYYRDSIDGCATEANFDDGFAFVDEEKQWTYEAGAKTSWLDNRITANLAVFYIDWDNQTFFETTSIPTNLGPEIPSNIGINAGRSHIFGLELETSFVITEKLIGTFAYGLSDGEFDEGFSDEFEAKTGIIGNDYGNLRGKNIPNSPKHNFVTSLTYTDSITAELGWFARTDFSYESRRYTSVTNFEEIGKRQIWNGRTGLETDTWTLTAFVNNILDEQTPSAIINFPRLLERNAAGIPPQGYALTPTPGRIIGGEVVLRFGR